MNGRPRKVVNSDAAAVNVEVSVLAGAGDDSYVCTDWTAQPQGVEHPQNSDQDQAPQSGRVVFFGGVWLSYSSRGGRAKQARLVRALSGGNVSMLC